MSVAAPAPKSAPVRGSLLVSDAVRVANRQLPEAYALPGLRIGSIACPDATLIGTAHASIGCNIDGQPMIVESRIFSSTSSSTCTS